MDYENLWNENPMQTSNFRMPIDFAMCNFSYTVEMHHNEQHNNAYSASERWLPVGDFWAVLFQSFHWLYARVEHCARAQNSARMLSTSKKNHLSAASSISKVNHRSFGRYKDDYHTQHALWLAFYIVTHKHIGHLLAKISWE